MDGGIVVITIIAVCSLVGMGCILFSIFYEERFIKESCVNHIVPKNDDMSYFKTGEVFEDVHLPENDAGVIFSDDLEDSPT